MFLPWRKKNIIQYCIRGLLLYALQLYKIYKNKWNVHMISHIFVWMTCEEFVKALKILNDKIIWEKLKNFLLSIIKCVYTEESSLSDSRLSEPTMVWMIRFVLILNVPKFYDIIESNGGFLTSKFLKKLRSKWQQEPSNRPNVTKDPIICLYLYFIMFQKYNVHIL